MISLRPRPCVWRFWKGSPFNLIVEGQRGFKKNCDGGGGMQRGGGVEKEPKLWWPWNEEMFPFQHQTEKGRFPCQAWLCLKNGSKYHRVTVMSVLSVGASGG